MIISKIKLVDWQFKKGYIYEMENGDTISVLGNHIKWRDKHGYINDCDFDTIEEVGISNNGNLIIQYYADDNTYKSLPINMIADAN